MVCKRRFGSNSSLQSHKMQHTDNRSNESKILKKVSKESQNMVKSARLKLKKLKQCDICNKIFTYTKCLIKHLEKHEIDKCYKCDVCGKEFAKYAALKTHLSLHTGERPHVCLVCGMSFIEYFSLWKHKREHTRDKTYACGVCGKIFSQLSNLNSHVRVHTPEDLNGGTKRSDLHHELKTCKKAPEEMKFQCKIDENKKENSTRHRTQALKRIASGKKLFACKDCERKFKRKGWLTRHYSTVHKHRNENYNNKKYTCEQCGAVFASEDDIINHQKCLNCMKCGKEFKCSYLFCFHNSPHLCQSSSQEFGDMNEGSEKPLRENYSINAVNEIKETLGMDNIYPRNQEELDSLDSEVVDELDYHIVVSSNAVEEISEPQALPDAAIYSDYGNCIETCNSSGEWLRFEYKSVLPAINNTNIGNRMSMSEWENMYIIENTASTPQEWGVWEVPYANKAPCTYHHMEHYANNGTHPCVICGLVFSTVTDLTTHAMGHITIV
ncbi:zinc finger protein 34 [Procambarus clarkii]|uniref:zinc finger protein 34 n=1 Tax=Procambarus clarkii TaxID=6728 RepID=UPI003743FEFD